MKEHETVKVYWTVGQVASELRKGKRENLNDPNGFIADLSVLIPESKRKYSDAL